MTWTRGQVTKSWSSLLIGCLVDKGLLSLDTTLENLFGDMGDSQWELVEDAAIKKALTVGELLTMQAPLVEADLAADETPPAQNSLIEVLNHAIYQEGTLASAK